MTQIKGIFFLQITILWALLASCKSELSENKNSHNKKNQEIKKLTENSKTIYMETLFVVDKRLYFSDGRRFYCSFRNWDHFYKLRNTKAPPKGLLEYKELPTGMKFIKECNLGILTKKFFE